jgi:hypothetical protein
LFPFIIQIIQNNWGGGKTCSRMTKKKQTRILITKDR